MSAKNKCKHLIVGITNPDPVLTKPDGADSQRSTTLANPLTYFERCTMIKNVMEDEGVNHKNLSIVPFPINFPELYRYYLPLKATFFLTIYDDWGRRKLAMFTEMGLKTEVLWDKPLSQKGIGASEVRHLMAENRPWEHLVPKAVERLMREWEIPQRIIQLLPEK
jgi:nicotinamide-nucleotide adenylyltransferase